MVLVFKTSLHNDTDVERIAPLLNGMRGVLEWNVALDDCDKVLRVVSSGISMHNIMALLHGAGYSCEEL